AQKNARITFAEDATAPRYQTDLLGSYQEKNAGGVVETIKELQGFKVTKEHIKRGLLNVVKNTGMLGRWQILGKNPSIICDTAHNKEGLQLVLEQLKRQNGKKLHIVLGFVDDKNVEQLLGLFPKKAKYYFVRPNVPRGFAAEELGKLALKNGLEGKIFKSVEKGLKKAMNTADKDDFIFVGGSTFVVAEVV
ncbi:MAG: cyanophycin synthetase, partial [Bacteroidota bacterium]